MSFHSTGIFGRRKVSANGVEQCLHTLVLERRAANHRVHLHSQCGVADSLADFLFGDGVGVVEIFLHEGLVELCECLEHFVAPFLGLFAEVVGNFVYLVFGTHGLVVPEDGFHLHQVNDALESFLGTDRNLDGERGSSEHFAHLAHYLEEVCAGAVHLVDVADAGNVILVGLAPNGFGLGFDAAYRAEGSHSAVEHAQRTFHLYGKVHVPRGVDEVDFEFVAAVVPESGGSGRCDGDTAFLLLLHPVHGGGAVVHLTDFVGQTGVEKDTFGSGSFAGIDVGHDADISR